MLTCHSLRSLAAVQVEASLKDRPHELASALTVQATHDASAAHQVLQGKLVRSTTSGAIAKGCGPYTEQAEGAVVSTLIKAVWSGQAAGQWGDPAAEAMPLLRATSVASSEGRRDSMDSLRGSSSSSGSSRSSRELAVLVNAPMGLTISDASSAGWLGSLGVEGSRGVSLAPSRAHTRGGSSQLLQFPSAAALLSSSAAFHRRHASEASPGDGSPAGGTGICGNAAAGHTTPAGMCGSGPGSGPSQVRCLCAGGPSAASEPHCANGGLSWPQCSNCFLVLI